MYGFLHRRLGAKWAFALTLAAYGILLVLIFVIRSGPAGEFRYGEL